MMKRNILMLLISAFLLAGCAVTLPPPRTNTVVINYRALTEQGIFITESNSVSFPYISLASVYIEDIGGFLSEKVDKTRADEDSGEEDIYRHSSVSSKNVYYDTNSRIILAKLAEELHKLGANGIINFQISETVEYHKELNIMLPKMIVKGMAIRRE